MVIVEVMSRNGNILDSIDRTIQTGTEGKLKNKEFVVYKNKRYIIYPGDRFNLFLILPWGLEKYQRKNVKKQNTKG